MAYDPSAEETANWIPVGRGAGATFAKPSQSLVRIWKKQMAWRTEYARLDPELRKEFPTDRHVNEALRKVIELRSLVPSPSRKRSA